MVYERDRERENATESQARENQGKPCNRQARVKGMSERKEVGRQTKGSVEGAGEGNKKGR